MPRTELARNGGGGGVVSGADSTLDGWEWRLRGAARVARAAKVCMVGAGAP
jgi:hypothetical protein